MTTDISSALRRLQAVTSQLESVANSGSALSADFASALSQLETEVSQLEAVPRSGSEASSAPADVVSASVLAYDDFCKGSVADFLQASEKIGGTVGEVGEGVKKLLEFQREFLVKASKCKKPKQTELQTLLKPMSEQIAAIQGVWEKNRGKQFFNHLSTINDGIGAFGWVCIEPTPGPYVKEMCDAVQFYGNKVSLHLIPVSNQCVYVVNET